MNQYTRTHVSSLATHTRTLFIITCCTPYGVYGKCTRTPAIGYPFTGAPLDVDALASVMEDMGGSGAMEERGEKGERERGKRGKRGKREEKGRRTSAENVRVESKMASRKNRKISRIFGMSREIRQYGHNKGGALSLAVLLISSFSLSLSYSPRLFLH